MKTFAAALALLPLLALPALAQQAAPVDAKALWEGNNLFCKNCHGKAGEGGFGPDLAGRGLSAAQFQQEVRKPWGVMPAFNAAQISDEEIAALNSWFNGMPKVAQPAAWRVAIEPQMPHGQQSYVSAGCAQCHGPTFDMARASLGGANADYPLFASLVYTHTTAMASFEPPRPGSRLRMGDFHPLRLQEGQLKEIYGWAHDDLGWRPALRATFTPGAAGAYALDVTNAGEPGKGLSATGVTIAVVIPAGSTVTAATGTGYQGVQTDAGVTTASWKVARLAPKDAQSFTLTLSSPPANPADLKGTIRWAKPGPKTGPNMDAVSFAARPAGPPR